MDRLVIRGGKPLVGSVTVSGAKNAALPAMAAVLLTSEELMLENVPSLQDVATIERLLGFMGVESREAAPGTVGLTSRAVRRFEVPYDLVRTMRASVLVLGPLLARFGKARVSLPGGCAIGPRPINLHLAGLQAMGAEIDLVEGYVVAKASRLSGTRLLFDTITVTGTENLMMAATLAKGTTVLENAACEPEVEDLARLLQKMGARIEGAGTSTYPSTRSISCGRCGPRFWCSGRSSPGSARLGFHFQEGVPLAPGLSTCIWRASKRWGPRSIWWRDMWWPRRLA